MTPYMRFTRKTWKLPFPPTKTSIQGEKLSKTCQFSPYVTLE